MTNFPAVTHSKAVKDPDATLDWGFDWNDPAADGGPWLAAGETIVASSWTVSPNTLTVGAASFTTTTTTQWLSGGTVGLTYLVTNHITTSAGRVDDRSWEIRIAQR